MTQHTIKSDPMVGIWMYQNGGGKNIQAQLISELYTRNIHCVTDLNLSGASAGKKGIFCGDIAMQDLSLFFTYNAGQQTAFQVYLYKTLANQIPMINNYAAFDLTEDKFRTSTVLAQQGIPTTDFAMFHRDDAAGLRQQMMQWDGKLVYKPTDGWGGSGIVKIESEASLEVLLAFLQRSESPFCYVERLVNYDKSDYRVDVVDGEFIGCYGRKAATDGWKTNVSSGGSVISRTANDEVIELALQAAAATGLEIAGVDLLFDEDRQQFIVLEVNGIPAFATPEQVELGLDFNDRKVQKIVNLIDRTVAERWHHEEVHYENIA